MQAGVMFSQLPMELQSTGAVSRKIPQIPESHLGSKLIEILALGGRSLCRLIRTLQDVVNMLLNSQHPTARRSQPPIARTPDDDHEMTTAPPNIGAEEAPKTHRSISHASHMYTYLCICPLLQPAQQQNRIITLGLGLLCSTQPAWSLLSSSPSDHNTKPQRSLFTAHYLCFWMWRAIDATTRRGLRRNWKI